MSNGRHRRVSPSSVGMHGSAFPELALAGLSPQAPVFDMVYAPLVTPLMEEARRHGLAAANGIGIKYMARSDADDVAVIGSGFQAETQLLAACATRDVKRMRCWSPSAENRAKFVATVPMGRLSKPSDIANACLYLASDEAEFITGVALEVDGGRCI